MKKYTIKEKEQEFFKYLKFELGQFEISIEYDDKTKLNQDTCDVIRLIKKFQITL